MNLTLTTPLLIIGAALPRTATTSIASALEQLGYKVFHASTMTEPFVPIWEDICQADTQGDSDQYDAAFDRFVQQLSDEGFNATLDQPSCFVYERLLNYYPNATVLETLRDAGSWARSMVEMAYGSDLYFWQPPHDFAWNVTKGPFGYWSKKQLGFRDAEIHPQGVPRNSNPYNYLERKSSVSLASCKVAYHRYHSQVKRTVQAVGSADQLVSFHPDEGWDPLCKHFLPPDRTCPSGPFPKVNTRSDRFLLDMRRKASTRVHLYKIHPVLSKQTWLVQTIVFGMKQRRAVLSFFQKVFPRKGKKDNKQTRSARTSRVR